MNRKLLFFGVLILVLYHIAGCNKQSSGPSTVPSIYREDDSTTGIFNYTGIAYDSAWVIDSIYPPSILNPSYPSAFHTVLKKYTHQISGQFRIKKLLSDSTVIHFTRPVNDKSDTVNVYSGLLFQTDKSYFENIPFDSTINAADTIIHANILNNKLIMQNYVSTFRDYYNGFIGLENGVGKFVNGKWEISFQTNGSYTTRFYANPNLTRYFLVGYHKYYLTGTK